MHIKMSYSRMKKNSRHLYLTWNSLVSQPTSRNLIIMETLALCYCNNDQWIYQELWFWKRNHEYSVLFSRYIQIFSDVIAFHVQTYLWRIFIVISILFMSIYILYLSLLKFFITWMVININLLCSKYWFYITIITTKYI